MKKRTFWMFLLLLTLISFSALADVEINAENFPDEAFRSYILEAFDVDGNQSLSEDELSGATEITCPESSIHSLKGVECFPALTTLDCSSNELTELDISKNTALTNLNCKSNRLSSLDVSWNTALTILNCGTNGSWQDPMMPGEKAIIQRMKYSAVIL